MLSLYYLSFLAVTLLFSNECEDCRKFILFLGFQFANFPIQLQNIGLKLENHSYSFVPWAPEQEFLTHGAIGKLSKVTSVNCVLCSGEWEM